MSLEVPDLVLYELEHSPFCIPVRLILQAWAVPYRREQVSAGDRRRVIELTHGGSYQVPVLEDGARVIYEPAPDSFEVPHYLDDRFCNGALFPGTVAGLHEVMLHYLENRVEDACFRLTDIHYIPSIADLVERVMVVRHKERKFGHGCLTRWAHEATALRHIVADALHPLEVTLARQPYLFGQQPVYADFLLAGILGNFTFNGWNELPPDLPHLTRFLAALPRWRPS